MTLVLTVIIVALIFEYINGFHDTANSIATVVSTKVLTPRQAIILAATTNLFGALVGTAVAKTVASGLVEAQFVSSHTIISALCGAIVWNLLTWWWGLPSSSSQALVGGLVGATLASAHGKWSSIIWSVPAGPNEPWWESKGILWKVVIPMFSSPLVGLVLGFLVMAFLYVFLRNWRPKTVNTVFGKLQLASAAYMGFSHGTNDAQKTMGIIALALAAATAAGTFDHLSGSFRWLYNPEVGPSVYVAQAQLADLHLEGESVSRDEKKAVRLLERAAKGKNVEAAAIVGEFYLRGEHVKKDDKKAAKLLFPAAEKGVPSAMTNYATLLREGRGVKVADPKKADALLAAAATNAPPKKATLMAKKFKEAPTNTAELVSWLQERVSKNNADAQVALGVLYAQGKGVTADPQKAIALFDAAAHRHVPEAYYNLAFMYREGLGVPKDPAKGAAYLNQASESEGIKIWIKVVCALTMAAGTAAGGWRIIKTLGHKMVKLQPVHGFAAETTAATVLYTAAAFGMPVSTTHAITASIMGVGCAKRFSALKFVVVERILWAWVFTIPASAGVAWLIMRGCQLMGWVQ
jgi:phosphate/sulfate permease